MSEFAGLVHLDGAPVDGASVARLTRSVLSPRSPSVWRPEPWLAFVEAREGMDPAPIQSRPGEILLADVWLDAPAEAAAALGLDRIPDDRALAAAACARWGVEAAAKRLSGDFSFAHWDGAGRRLTIARDALGTRPVYYVATPRYILFATSLQAMMAMPETPRDLDEVVLAHVLSIAMQDQEQTLYRHIRRVPPGGTAIFEKGEVRTSRWFTAGNIAPVRFASDQEYVEAARAELDRSVGARLPRQGPFATGLSGGFDSGGVTATAARLLGDRRLTAFTRVSADPNVDDGGERRLAGLLVERYPNIDWVVVDEVREAIRDTMPESEAGATLLPRTSSFNATWFEALAIRVERSGVEVILNGGCGNSTLSYAGHPQIAEDLRGGRVSGAVQGLRGLARQRGTSLARTAASQLYGAFAPRALKRWRTQRRDGAMPWLRYSLVSPDFLSDLDYAEHARARGHDVPFDLPVSSREARLRMIQGQTGRDFRAHGKRKRKYISRDPYCDRRMVEFCLGIPEDQYWRDGQSRWLAKRALADRMPAETLDHVAIGVQSADWYMVASSRREAMAEAVERIARSPIASRVLDVPRMRKLLDTWPKDAEEAARSFMLHGHALQRAIAMGGFLRWHEGRND